MTAFSKVHAQQSFFFIIIITLSLLLAKANDKLQIDL